MSCSAPERLAHALLGRELRIDAGERLFRLDHGVPELDERVPGDELASAFAGGNGNDLGDRALELENDPLRGLLADSRDDLEPRRVAERDRAPELVRRGARHDGERDLRPDSADPEQLDEQRALGRVGEAVELQRVLADVEVRLHSYLDSTLRPTQDTGRRAHEVPDARDV